MTVADSSAGAALSTDSVSAPNGRSRTDRGGMARLSPTLRAISAGATALDAIAPRLTTELMLRHFTRPRRKPGNDYRDRLPPGAQQLSLSHGNQSLTAWAWGDTGPALLLVHGWEDHTGSMLGFVPSLLELGYRVFVLDAPGHGLSPRATTHLLDISLPWRTWWSTLDHSTALSRTPLVRPLSVCCWSGRLR